LFFCFSPPWSSCNIISHALGFMSHMSQCHNATLGLKSKSLHFSTTLGLLSYFFSHIFWLNGIHRKLRWVKSGIDWWVWA
jgi:hypothetical protein